MGPGSHFCLSRTTVTRAGEPGVYTCIKIDMSGCCRCDMGGAPIQFSPFSSAGVPMTRVGQQVGQVLQRSHLSWRLRYPQRLKTIWGELSKRLIVLQRSILWSESRFPRQRDYKQKECYLDMQNYCQCFFGWHTVKHESEAASLYSDRNKQHSLCLS